MIKRFFNLSLVTVSLIASASSAAKADDLFSRTSMNAAFSNTASATEKAAVAEDETPEKGRRLLSVTQLADLLREIGFEPEAKDQTVKFAMEHSRWKFPMEITLSADFERIQISVQLSQFDNQKQPSADRLLGLMAANRDFSPAFFSFNGEKARVELLIALKNDQLGPKMLKSQLDSLAKMAETTAELWENDAKSLATGNLVGKWSAARSATEAFALLLNTDGSFVLVSVKKRSKTKSTGKFSLADGQMSLAASDGGKLVGKINNLKPDAFEFSPLGPSTSKMTFNRAK